MARKETKCGGQNDNYCPCVSWDLVMKDENSPMAAGQAIKMIPPGRYGQCDDVENSGVLQVEGVPAHAVARCDKQTELGPEALIVLFP